MVQEKHHEYKAGERCPRCNNTLVKDEDEIKCPTCSRVYATIVEKKEVSQIIKIDRSTISDDENEQEMSKFFDSLSKSAANNESIDSAHNVPGLTELSDKLSALKPDDAQQTEIKIQNKPKAHIALEESDTEDFGIVKDTRNDIMWVSGKGDIIGTWSRSRVDGLIHISLLTSIEALYDRAVLTWSKNIEMRKIQKTKKQRSSDGTKPEGTRKVGRPKLDKPQQTVVIPDKDRVAINDMKAKLMGLR